MASPELQNQDPTPGSTGNDSNTNIYLEIYDENDDLDISTVDIYINGDLAWSGDSVQQPGFSGFKSPITNGYGYTISPWEEFTDGLQTIRVVASDLALNSIDESYQFSTTRIESTLPPVSYEYTGLGIHPFVTSIENPSAGVLEVQFNEIMLNDISLGRPSSYIITPQGDASSVFITDVVVDRNDTSKVTLSFVGGGSYYILSTPGLMDPAGNYCFPYDFLFEITNPTIDELEASQKLFLDTDMGPMVLGFSELTKRRVEDLAILRAKNEGHLRQFSLISDELERSGIDRDDRKLKLFKG